MTLNKTTRKEKFYQKMKNALLQENARKFSLFKQCNFFNGEGFFKIMSLRFTLMKALKSSIRLHWCQHMFLPSHEESEMGQFCSSQKKVIFLMIPLRRFRSYNHKVIILACNNKKETRFFLSQVKILLNLYFNKIFEVLVKTTIRNYKTFRVSFRFCSFVTNERHFVT